MHHLAKLPLVLVQLVGSAVAATVGRRKPQVVDIRDTPVTITGPVRIGLVGCVKKKRSDGPMPAKDLYDSALFRGRRAHAEATCDRWFILSAEHGLMDPERITEDYDNTLIGKPATTKRLWANQMLLAIDALDLDYAETVFELQVGSEYRNFGLVDGLRSRGAAIEIPFEGLTQGQQLAAYKNERTA